MMTVMMRPRDPPPSRHRMRNPTNLTKDEVMAVLFQSSFFLNELGKFAKSCQKMYLLPLEPKFELKMFLIKI